MDDLTMTDPQLIFKYLRSDNEAERIVAANKLHAFFTKNGGHPDDWIIREKNGDSLRRLADMEASLRKNAEEMRKYAEADAAKERKARAKTQAENAKLREQLDKAKQAKPAPDPTVYVDLFSGLLSQAEVDKLTPEQIAGRIQALNGDRDRREHNMAAQVDLVIGQLTEALYQRHTALFGKRKRGSNAPTVQEFLETHAGKSASWCRRCFKAYIIATADDWDDSSWDGTGGIEGIIKSATDPNRPKAKRVSKVQKRLDALTDAVRRREWHDAEEMVNTWDSTLS
jgi:hypothetical protein